MKIDSYSIKEQNMKEMDSELSKRKKLDSI